jgi:hypothetical protein
MSSNIEVKLDVLNQLATPAMYAAALANRPAAGFVGRIFFDSDNPSTGIYRDTGTTWVQVADETGTIPTPTLQTVTTAGNTSNVGISISANGIGIGTTIPASNRLDIHTATGINATFNGTGTTNSALQLQSAGVGKWTIQNNYNSAANDFVITDVLNSVNRLQITNTGIGTLTASLSATKTATYSSGGTYGIYGNDNYTIPAATSFGSGGLIFASLQGVQNFTYGGNATYDNSALNGSVVGINQIQFSSTGTITMTQATGVRAMTAGIFQNQFLGTTNGTITHLAGIEVLGVYKASTGIATITNAYGLLINNIDDYTSGFAFTNRWGIYQAGTSDSNYFAGKVVLGSTTVGTDQLQVTGSSKFTGTFAIIGNSTFTGTTTTSSYSYQGNGIAQQTANTKMTIWNRMANVTGTGVMISDFNSVGDSNLTINIFEIAGGWYTQNSSIDNTFVISRTIDLNANTNSSSIIRGFYYTPNIINLYAAQHRAIETVTGAVLFGTTSGSVGIGATTTINASSILQVTSTSQGFLPPRMTTAQKNAIATPATGLVVYDTTLNKLALYTGAAWETVTSI